MKSVGGEGESHLVRWRLIGAAFVGLPGIQYAVEVCDLEYIMKSVNLVFVCFSSRTIQLIVPWHREGR